MLKTLGQLSVVVLLAFAATGIAKADSLTFQSVAGSDSDGAVSGTVTITAVNGGLEVVVTNNETASGLAKGQAVSDFSFTVGGALGTPTAFTSLSGIDEASATIGSGGSWNSTTCAMPTTCSSFNTTASSNVADHWGFSTSSKTVTVATAGTGAPGGNPHWMILPASGTAGPSSSLSDSHFDPYIIGPGTFMLTDSGVTSTTMLDGDISNVMISFGTGSDVTLDANLVPAVPTPDPSTFSLVVLGLICLVGAALLGRKRQPGLALQ